MKMNFFSKMKFPLKFGIGMMSFYYLSNNKNPEMLFGIFGNDPFNDLKTKANDIYIWGNGVYQAKPGSVPSFLNYFPKKQEYAKDKNNNIHKSPDLIDIVYHPAILVGIDKNGNLWKFNNKEIQAQESDIEGEDLCIEYKDKPSKIFKYDNYISELGSIQGKDNTKTVKIVKDNIYILNNKGKVYRSKIDKIINDKPEWKEINSLSNITQMESGKNHLLFLNKDGNVFALGDDTHGQCGLGSEGRISSGPFTSRIIRNPKMIEALDGQNIKKIYTGGEHNFAVSKSGQLFGWGFNNLMQLGHEDQYSSASEPLLAIFEPVNMSADLEDKILLDVALGKDFSLFICRNKETGYTEVHGMGHNSEGQLGSGFPRHIQKLTKLEPLSDFDYLNKDKKRIPLELNISCGNSHCIAKGSNGVLLAWGANKKGQLGNKKRSFTGQPIILRDFSLNDVEYFKAFNDQSFVSLKKKNLDSK